MARRLARPSGKSRRAPSKRLKRVTQDAQQYRPAGRLYNNQRGGRGYHRRMSRVLPRPTRWSKKTDELVRYVAHGCRPALQSELGHWLEDSSRFRTFVNAHQDKVRKKLSTTNEESRLDIRAELLVAYSILGDRRFELTFEAYGARQLGPDLTITYRANQRFNLEVTRLRAIADTDAGSAQPGSSVARLANVVAGKLRQLPGDVANALAIVTRGLAVDEETLVGATRLLKQHNDRNDDAFFARRGLKTARDFYAQYLRLGGVFVLDEATTPPGAIFSANREARHPLPREAVVALIACLTRETHDS